jgi:hypothetical protein
VHHHRPPREHVGHEGTLLLFPVCEVLFPGDRTPVHKRVLLRFHKRYIALVEAQNYEGKGE